MIGCVRREKRLSAQSPLAFSFVPNQTNTRNRPRKLRPWSIAIQAERVLPAASLRDSRQQSLLCLRQPEIVLDLYLTREPLQGLVIIGPELSSVAELQMRHVMCYQNQNTKCLTIKSYSVITLPFGFPSSLFVFCPYFTHCMTILYENPQSITDRARCVPSA